MTVHDESVCPGCGEQAAGEQFCPSCGLLIGSFQATATPATPTPAEPESAEPVSAAAGPVVPYPSPSNPWAAPFTAVERSETLGDTLDTAPLEPAADSDHDDSHVPVASSFFTTEDPTTAEPETADSGPEPVEPETADSSPEPVEPETADSSPEPVEPETADSSPEPAPLSLADPVAVPAPPLQLPTARGSRDRRAAVACIAALLFVIVVLTNRGLRR